VEAKTSKTKRNRKKCERRINIKKLHAEHLKKLCNIYKTNKIEQIKFLRRFACCTHLYIASVLELFPRFSCFIFLCQAVFAAGATFRLLQTFLTATIKQIAMIVVDLKNKIIIFFIFIILVLDLNVLKLFV